MAPCIAIPALQYRMCGVDSGLELIVGAIMLVRSTGPSYFKRAPSTDLNIRSHQRPTTKRGPAPYMWGRGSWNSGPFVIHEQVHTFIRIVNEVLPVSSRESGCKITGK